MLHTTYFVIFDLARILLSLLILKRIDGPIADKGENEIREHFDVLLDFFGKLGYLLDIKVISKRSIFLYIL